MTRSPYPEVEKGDRYRCFDCGALQEAASTREEMIAEAEREGVATTAAALGPDWEIVLVCDDCYQRRAKGVS